jgi:hypothetical protein
MITYRLRTLAEMTVVERDMQYHFGPGSLFLTLYSPPSHGTRVARSVIPCQANSGEILRRCRPIIA